MLVVVCTTLPSYLIGECLCDAGILHSLDFCSAVLGKAPSPPTNFLQTQGKSVQNSPFSVHKSAVENQEVMPEENRSIFHGSKESSA